MFHAMYDHRRLTQMLTTKRLYICLVLDSLAGVGSNEWPSRV
jgi:hypothetical protein